MGLALLQRIIKIPRNIKIAYLNKSRGVLIFFFEKFNILVKLFTYFLMKVVTQYILNLLESHLPFS